MKKLAYFRNVRAITVLLAASFLSLACAEEGGANYDLLAKRALAQKAPDWNQALGYFLQAHRNDPGNSERYRSIAACLQNLRRPLAAAAWYQAFRSSKDANPEWVTAAGKQVDLLMVDVRAKVGGLFAEAANIAEKQLVDSLAANGSRIRQADSMFVLPRYQAESGMLDEALAIEKRRIALGLTLANHSLALGLESRPFYRPQKSFGSLRDGYVFATALTGDLVTVQEELARNRGPKLSEHEEREKAITGYTPHEHWTYLAELIRYNLSKEANYRVAWAEKITAEDPMENIDARTSQILSQNRAAEIPEALGSMAAKIGNWYLKVLSMRPENANGAISREARRFALLAVQRKQITGFAEQEDEFTVISRATAQFGSERQ